MSRIKADSGMQEPHDRDPRERDRSIFDQRSVSVRADARDWQKSDAGRAYLDGVNGFTVLGRAQQVLSPAEYRDKYGT